MIFKLYQPGQKFQKSKIKNKERVRAKGQGID